MLDLYHLCANTPAHTLGCNMPHLLINNKEIPLDKEGYLINLTDWNEDVASAIALDSSLDLSPEHWEILHLLRDFHHAFEHAPAMRILVKAVKNKLGDKKGNSIYLLTLFPNSPAKLAARIAGLPRPTNCL